MVVLLRNSKTRYVKRKITDIHRDSRKGRVEFENTVRQCQFPLGGEGELNDLGVRRVGLRDRFSRPAVGRALPYTIDLHKGKVEKEEDFVELENLKKGMVLK